MKVQAKINILDGTRNGTSMASGKPWVSKECVVELTEPNSNGTISTMACVATDFQVVSKMEQCAVGDVAVLDLNFTADARTWEYKNGVRAGQIGIERSTKAYIVDFEVLPPESF